MSTTDNPSEFLQRAAMHEQLAAATDDAPARKMHLAMAAEYRRKAQELSERMGRTIPGAMDRIVKLEVSMR